MQNYQYKKISFLQKPTNMRLPYLKIPSTDLFNSVDKGFVSFESIDNKMLKQHINQKQKKIYSTLKMKTEHLEVVSALSHNRQKLKKLNQSIATQRDSQYNQYIRNSNRYNKLLQLNTRKSKLASIVNGKVGEVKVINIFDTRPDDIFYQIQQNKIRIPTWKPEPREGQICIGYKDYIILIGGQNNYPLSISNISIYSFRQNQWIKKIQSEINRSYHTGLIYKSNYIIIFGGMSSILNFHKQRQCLNSVCLYDIVYQNLKNIKIDNQQIVEGRRNHSACIMGKYMIIYGGINTKKKYLADFKYLDLKQLKWYHKDVKYQSEILQEFLKNGLAKHTMFINFNKKKSYPLHSSQYEDSEGIFIFGGANSLSAPNGMLQIRLNKFVPVFYKLHPSGIPPSSVDPISMKQGENTVIIISGQRHQRQIRLYLIRENEYISIQNGSKISPLGGIYSSLIQYKQNYYLLFGLGQKGYLSTMHEFKIKQMKKYPTKKKKMSSAETQKDLTSSIDSGPEQLYDQR